VRKERLAEPRGIARERRKMLRLVRKQSDKKDERDGEA